jgi:AcrR family transcriptional regulator
MQTELGVHEMTSSEPVGQRPAGLRERKKAKTRAAIQQEAMRLFRERGYADTTVEEIAEAAEVSESTFFRYFPTKEDVVLRDDYDELLLQAFLAQPRHLSPLQAAKAALDGVVGLATRLSPEERELENLRTRLTFTVPEVRARWADEASRAFRQFAGVIAERAGRSPDDLRVRTFTGALFGVLLAVFEPIAQDPSRDWTEMMPELDQAFELLQQGLPL